MAHYAYLRVSTDQQDVDNQRHGILEYANKLGLSGVVLVEDTVSGKKNWQDRKSGELLTKTMKSGDQIIFAEVSRMARSTLQVLEMLEFQPVKRIVHSRCSGHCVLDPRKKYRFLVVVNTLDQRPQRLGGIDTFLPVDAGRKRISNLFKLGAKRKLLLMGRAKPGD